MKQIHFLITILAFIPAAILAHPQPGPPYLQINGNFAATNALANLVPGAAQDIAVEPYITGEPVHFSVDTSVVSGDREYGWKWADGAPTTDIGTSVYHTFSTPGSYLVTLLARPNSTSQFTPYNTVQVDIIPHKTYMRPTAKIIVETSGKDAAFKVQANIDPSAQIKSYDWRFGDGATGTGQNVSHDYKDIAADLYPSLRLTDTEGITREYGWRIAPNGSGISAFALPGMDDISIIKKPGPDGLLVIIFAIVSLSGLAATGYFLVKHQARPR